MIGLGVGRRGGAERYHRILRHRSRSGHRNPEGELWGEDNSPLSQVIKSDACHSKGHTLLDRLSGANKDALAALVERHGRIVTKPLSHTDQAPAKAPPAIPSEGEEKKETEEELDERLRRLMNQDKVVLFMKGSPDAPRCGFSRKIVGLLRDQGVEFKYFDILTDESVRQGNDSLFRNL